MPVVLLAVGVCAAAALAFVNGANDVSKAIATLVGAKEARIGTAIGWGTLWTTAGALAGSVVSMKLVRLFAENLVEPDVQLSLAFGFAIVIGASGWVALAAWRGWPVSTTHAVAGAVVAVASFAYGLHHVTWSVVASKLVVPLVCAPFLALPVAIVVRKGLELLPDARVGSGMHWLSSATVSFARGLNDAPKVVGVAAILFIGASHSEPTHLPLLFGVVAVAMGVGSAIGGVRVLKVLANDVVPMTHKQGLVANLTTAVLVLFASRAGFPVSTTHVSGCAIMALSHEDHGRSLNWNVVRNIGLAWLTTAPAAGVIGICSYWALKATGFGG